MSMSSMGRRLDGGRMEQAVTRSSFLSLLSPQRTGANKDENCKQSKQYKHIVSSKAMIDEPRQKESFFSRANKASPFQLKTIPLFISMKTSMLRVLISITNIWGNKPIWDSNNGQMVFGY